MKLIIRTVVLAVMMNFLLAVGVWANAVHNGDFSAGFEGWSTEGNFSIKTMHSMPSNIKKQWDLTPWNAVMDGKFSLFQTPSKGYLAPSVHITAPSIPVSASFDYAVAYSGDADPRRSYGYFYLQVFGIGSDLVNKHLLAYYEIQWSGETDVITGNVTLPSSYFIPRLPYYHAFVMDFSFFNPYGNDYVVGIDNVTLNVSPVPVPDSCILLATGLAGLWILPRRKSS